MVAGLGFDTPERWLTQLDSESIWVRLSTEYGFLDSFYTWLVIKPIKHLAELVKLSDAADLTQTPGPETSHVIGTILQTEKRAVDGLVRGIGISTVVLAHIVHSFDRLVIDGIINGAVWLAGRLGQLVRSVQNGRIQSYVTAAVVGLLVLLWWLL